MKKMSFYISLIFARILYFFMRITKISSGTAIIGLLVLKICPDFLKFANSFISNAKINISGTNGKTTTSGLLSHLIATDNKQIINNASGANMLNGIVNALSLQINPFKKSEYSVIECDEAFLEVIYDKFEADYLLVTNLFRDQLDRFGELAFTKKLIQNGIDKKENIQLILNADDPLVASLSSKNKQAIYYGLDSIEFRDGLEHKEVKVEEAFTCPCGKALKYSKKFFAQQGHYYCDCGYSRPEPKYHANVVLHKNHLTLTVDGEDFDVPLVGLFNAYNALASIALAKELGIKNIKDNIKTFKVAFGRSEVKMLNGHRTLIQLIKNPVGASEVLKSVDLDSNILICINDKYADGRDVSWLWDADFEALKNAKKEIIVSGIRANDIALRLKYAEINNVKIINDIDKAIKYIGEVAEKDITILPTYTALLKISKMKNLRSI